MCLSIILSSQFDDECPATNLQKIKIKQTGFLAIHKKDPYKYRQLQDNPDGYGVSLAMEKKNAEEK